MMVALQDYGIPLEMVAAFKDLGKVFTASDDDWTALVTNICKAWSRWARFSRIFGLEG